MDDRVKTRGRTNHKLRQLSRIDTWLLVDGDLKPPGGFIGLGFEEMRWPRLVRPGDEPGDISVRALTTVLTQSLGGRA